MKGEAKSNSPETVSPTGDHGDDIARRFRYQATYAAVTCVMLLDGDEDTIEIYCEHHEDVLLKHKDETFSGLQIKTRASDQLAWKANDDAVVASLARFASLEKAFPGSFRRYRFLTNHPIYSSKNAKSPLFVLESIRASAALGSLSGPVGKFLKVISGKASCGLDVVYAALKKTDAMDNLPKLPDMEVRLMGTLSELWPPAKECSFESLQRAAHSLANACIRASSLAHEDLLPAYLAATRNPANIDIVSRLNGKRFTSERLGKILSEALDRTMPLDGDSRTLPEPGRGEGQLLEKKLDAGGFSVVSVNSAQDLRTKADYLGAVWINKHGREAGLQRYSHVRSLVLNDAGTAFEAEKNRGDPFGFAMLLKLRALLQERRSQGSVLYDASDEHLEGFGYVLTSECLVQWSVARPWEGEQ